MNPFRQPDESYTRDYDIVGNWTKSMAKTISLNTGHDIDKVMAYVQDKVANEWKPTSPQLNALTRKPRMDRKKSKGDLLSYLKWVDKNNHILSPNLICYANPEIEESFLSGFISNNLKMRSAVKKEGQKAKMQGDKAHAVFCNLLQANYKIRNNSISGALSSPHNPLYYASSHTSLTSVCRAITSYANACNEKFLASNRHYFTPEVTIENIAYITRAADYTKIEDAMTRFYISPPSVEFVCKLIFDSTKLYWNNPSKEAEIRLMVKNMTPLERAAFAFTGDFHALHQSNDKAMRVLFDRILARPTPFKSKEDAQAALKIVDDDDMTALGTMLCSDWMKGRMAFELNDEEYCLWAAYIDQVHTVINEYKPFVDAFLSTKIMPSSIHSLPTIVRRVVVGSDTDSSIFSTQKQVEWYTGRIDFSHASVCAGAITSYMVCQLVSNVLRNMSGQMCVGIPQLSRLGMKSEFYSKAQINTSTTKTYAMDITACEGNYYGESQLEVKGVILKSSKLPTAIRRASEDFMWYCLEAPGVEGGISPLEPASIIATVEHGVFERLNRGEARYLRTEQMRNPESYTNPMSSPYAKFLFWNEVFGEKYGLVEQLPADGVKVNVTLGKEKDVVAWAETLEPKMKRAVLEYCHKYNKKYFTSLIVPYDLLVDGCIPEELIRVMDTRKIVGSMMDPFYVISNGLGLNVRNSKLTHFFSDDFTVEEAKSHLPADYKIDI